MAPKQIINNFNWSSAKETVISSNAEGKLVVDGQIFNMAPV